MDTKPFKELITNFMLAAEKLGADCAAIAIVIPDGKGHVQLGASSAETSHQQLCLLRQQGTMLADVLARHPCSCEACTSAAHIVATLQAGASVPASRKAWSETISEPPVTH